MTSVLPRPARPAAVLFDMDGTLIDSEHLWLRAEILTMERLGGSWSEADQAACLGGPLERAVDYMIERAGGGHDPADVAGHLLDDMESLLRSSPLVWQPGARALLLDARSQDIPTARTRGGVQRRIAAATAMRSRRARRKQCFVRMIYAVPRSALHSPQGRSLKAAAMPAA